MNFPLWLQGHNIFPEWSFLSLSLGKTYLDMYFLNMGEKVKSIRICNADLCMASSLKALALTWCSKTLEDLQENTLSDAEAAGSQQL